MFKTFKILGTAAALSLAVLLPTAHAQSLQAQGRMNKNAVAVTSNAPVTTTVEAVLFSGQAIVNSRMSPDPTYNRPSLILDFDLSQVVGVGAKSGIRYILPAEEYVIRPHASNQVVELTFPMTTGPDAPLANARTGHARFAMNVDTTTGVITSLAAVFTAR